MKPFKLICLCAFLGMFIQFLTGCTAKEWAETIICIPAEEIVDSNVSIFCQDLVAPIVGNLEPPEEDALGTEDKKQTEIGFGLVNYNGHAPAKSVEELELCQDNWCKYAHCADGSMYSLQ